jgi:hypothetical protein
MKFRVTRRDALRGSVAGTQGHAARCAAHALFEAGGRAVLPAPVQSAVRVAVEREASRVLAAVGVLESGATSTARMLEGGAARAVAAQTVRTAGRQILRSVGAAAGAGAVIDGGWALVQAVRGVRRGSMTQREAAAHVAREATTGAVATAAGATAAVLLVALTGGVAAPAVFLVGAAASIGAKAGLDRWLHVRSQGEVQVRVESPESASTA